MLSVKPTSKKPKKRVRFSPDIIVEYTADQDTSLCEENQQNHLYKSHLLLFAEEDNLNALSLYEDFYDSYQCISEYGNVTVAPHDIYIISNKDLMNENENEIEIDMKSISIDTVSTSCDDSEFSTIAYPMRALPYYSPETIAGLPLKKKFDRDIYFKSRYFWCDPIGKSINWFVIYHSI